MNSKEYIESGILEQYVIGSLSADEMTEVEKNLAIYPELKSELKSIESALELYAKSHGVNPNINEDVFVEKITGKKISSSSPNFWAKWLPWLIFLPASLGFIFNTIKLNSRLLKSEKEITTVKKGCEEVSKQNQGLINYIDILLNPENKKVILKGTSLSPNAFASVVITDNKQIYLSSQGLPLPSEDKQYQLWALKNGKPIDMGVFDVLTDTLITISNVEGAQAYAITLEKKGGSIVPTLDQMVVMGEI